MLFRHRTAPVVSALCAFFLIGCDVTPLVKDEGAGMQPHSLWRQSRDGISVAFTMTPEMPEQSREAVLRLAVQDVSTPTALPAVDATIIAIAAVPSAPGHVLELPLEPSAAETGVYSARARFDMKGEWLAKILIRLPSGRKTTAEFSFRVR